MFLGLCFLSLKGTEYYLEAKEGLVPGINFQTIKPEEKGLPPARQHPRPVQERLFMIFYYLLTALHAVHMTIGIFVLIVLMVLTCAGTSAPSTIRLSKTPASIGTLSIVSGS